ncbi:MAG TPA: amidohydrolase family protein [Xanthobacteraceae bacterium]|jgi:cytosine/adenosine deaminase-related metal-dependent hydrolase
MSRILIKGGTVIRMDRRARDLPKGDVLIENDKIVEVARDIDAPKGAEVIDASDMIVLPGFVNAHLHTWQSGLRGIGGDWSVPQYMSNMHRGLATHFRPEDIYIANLMGALTSLNSGITTLVDWCHNNPTPEHTDAAIDGLEESGIRAAFLHGSPKPNPKPGEKHFSYLPMPRGEIERLRRGRLARRDGMISLGLAILGPTYSVWEVTQQDMRLAKELDLIVSMHVGGGAPIVADGFERLAKEKLLTDRTNIVHGNNLSDQVIELTVDRGVQYTVTADVEMQMGFCNPLTGKLMRLGAPVSIGTDVEVSARADMFYCMRVTLQTQRNLDNVEHWHAHDAAPDMVSVTCRQALEWATVNGAKMIHQDHRIGSLAPGKQADIVLLRADDLTIFPVHDPVSSVVTQGGLTNVDTVLVAGRVMKRNGKLLVEGLPGKMAMLRRSAERIMADFGLRAPKAA